MNWHRVLRGLVMIGSLVVVGYVLEATHFGAIFNEAWIDNEIRGQGMFGELLFVGIGTLALALALPRQIVSFLGGYAFGFVLGSTLALVASTISCVLTFSYARLIGRRFVAHRQWRAQPHAARRDAGYRLRAQADPARCVFAVALLQPHASLFAGADSA